MRRWCGPLLLAAGAASAQPVVFADAPVRISAEARPARAGADFTSIVMSVQDGPIVFRLGVAQRGNAADALAAQKARSGWKEGFLFIRDECLGLGVTATSWRCSLDHVFTFVEGREGRRLIYLGEVYAGDDCVAEARFGCALYEKTFSDIYDLLEENALTSHAEAPQILLELQPKSGELAVDLPDTWQRNQERFQAGERCLAAASSDERKAQCSEGITPRRAYLFNAALATYTQREQDLTRIRNYARSALCENMGDLDCTATLRASALILARVAPGTKPRPRNPARTSAIGGN